MKIKKKKTLFDEKGMKVENQKKKTRKTEELLSFSFLSDSAFSRITAQTRGGPSRLCGLISQRRPKKKKKKGVSRRSKEEKLKTGIKRVIVQNKRSKTNNNGE